MRLGEVVRQARKQAGLSQEALGAKVGVSGAAVGQWESGKTTPSGANTLRLIDILGLDADDLLDACYGVREARAACTSRASAPVYGTIAAGVPIESVPVEDSYWVDPKVLTDHPDGFYVRVRGESMNRWLADGDLAFVDPSAEVSSGDVAAVNVNGYEATIKRVLIGASSITLVPESHDPAYKDETYAWPRDDEVSIRVIGKVVWHVTPYGGRL